MILWRDNNVLLIDESSRIILCNECPCEEGGCTPAVLFSNRAPSSVPDSNVGGLLTWNPIRASSIWPSVSSSFTIEEGDMVWAFLYVSTNLHNWNIPSGWITVWTGQLVNLLGGNAIWWIGWRHAPQDTTGPDHDIPEYKFTITNDVNAVYTVRGMHLKCAGDVTLWSENTGTSSLATSTGITIPETGGVLFQIAVCGTGQETRRIQAPSSSSIDIEGVIGDTSANIRRGITNGLGIGMTGNITNEIRNGAGALASDNWKALQIFIPDSQV